MHGSADMAWRAKTILALQSLLSELDEHKELLAAVFLAQAIDAMIGAEPAEGVHPH